MTATERIDPTKAVGRLLTAGWRVERTFGNEGGVMLRGPREVDKVGSWWPHKQVHHGELVEVVVETTCPDCGGCGKFGGPGSYYDRPGGKPCRTCDGDGVVIEDTPADDVTAAVRQAVQ